jgi:cytochrome d ubiquinol oxidase subunit II
VVGAVASGRVPADGEGDAISSWTGSTSILVGLLAVATGAYLAAVFLAADSQRAGLPDLVEAFRRRALGAVVVAGGLAIGGLFVIRDDARELYDGLTSGAGIAFVVISALAGLVTLGLLLRRRFGLARWSSAAAVGALVAGWGVGQRPDFLPGELTFEAAAAGDATLAALVISFAIAAAILIPSLTLLYRLTLQGRLDTEFRPITAGDRGPLPPRRGTPPPPPADPEAEQ